MQLKYLPFEKFTKPYYHVDTLANPVPPVTENGACVPKEPRPLNFNDFTVNPHCGKMVLVMELPSVYVQSS